MGKTKTLFLADDDADDLGIFEEALREICCETLLNTAGDGVELLEALVKTHQLPDVIFLDLNMPRMTGFECLIELKKSPRLQKIPVVILSTATTDEMIDKVYLDGAHFYVTKPATFEGLKSVIRHILSITLALQPSKEKFRLAIPE